MSGLADDGCPPVGDVRWWAAAEFNVHWREVTAEMIDAVTCHECWACYRHRFTAMCAYCWEAQADAERAAAEQAEVDQMDAGSAEMYSDAEDARIKARAEARRDGLYAALTVAVGALVADGADPSYVTAWARQAAHNAACAYSYDQG